MQKIRKIVHPDTKYTKIKYKQDIYSLGDNLLVREGTDSFLIGKLISIIPSNGNKQYSYWPTIEVQWYEICSCRYYKKSDINRERNGLTSEEKFNSISEFEVFRSDHKDVIFIETIMSTCTV